MTTTQKPKPTPTDQDTALETIRREVAAHGKPTFMALQVSIQHGINREDYQRAIREGMARHAGGEA